MKEEDFNFLLRAEKMRELISSHAMPGEREVGQDGFEHCAVSFPDGFSPSGASLYSTQPEIMETPRSRLSFYNCHVTDSIRKYLEFAVALGCPRVFWGVPLRNEHISEDTWEEAVATVGQLSTLVSEYSVPWLCLSLYLHYVTGSRILSVGGYVSVALENFVIMGALAREIELSVLNREDAYRGRKIKNSARQGGEAHRSTHEQLRRKIIASMDIYISGGHSKRNAARLTNKDGIGTSTEANVKIYTRHKKS